MGTRKSIEVPGYGHGPNPIPAASRIGNMVITGGIHGTDTETGKIPADAIGQCANVFANVRKILSAAGASTENIIKMNFWVRDAAARDAINKEWVAMFPDAHSRPARHTLVYDKLSPAYQLQCDFIAVIE
ncbi:MAG TPA: RidA family protein [Stellaceae bacterium]